MVGLAMLLPRVARIFTFLPQWNFLYFAKEGEMIGLDIGGIFAKSRGRLDCGRMALLFIS